MIPGNGIYAAWARIGRETLPAAVNVGVRPTFGGTELLIEAHIIDFDREIYGSVLTLDFVEKLRPELQFENADALVAAIRDDVAQVRRLLKTAPVADLRRGARPMTETTWPQADRPRETVVVKAGSSSLVRPTGDLDPDGLEQAVDHVAGMWDRGHPTLLVSSGAVAAGIPALGLTGRPRDVPGLQAAAAVGQGLLMERYAAMFKSRGKIVGQVLLTKDVLANRSQYLNARNTLERMLSLGVVPIINENDTVVVDEFRLGGNDELAAIVSHLVSAGMLVILTDFGGIYSGDPRTMDDVELLSAVHSGDTALDHIAGGAPGPFGSGGPATKVMAARMAAWSGIPTVIADARESRRRRPCRLR